MIYEFLLGGVSIFVFLFIFWKKLKEDYSSSIIFSTGFTVIFALLLGTLLSRQFLPLYWFWVALLFISIATFWSVFRLKLKLFEVIEAVFAGIIPWLSFVFLYDSIKVKSFYSLGIFVVLVGVYFLYFFLNGSYKKFSWYVSGKIGFSVLASIGVLFLARGLASLTAFDMLSFTGKLDTAFSGAVAVASFLTIFYLARQVE